MARKKKIFSPPFRTGDVVKYVGKDRLFSKVGEIHVIKECVIRIWSKTGWEYKYGTNHGAWYHHHDFELVRECDTKSIKVLIKAFLEEYGDEL